MVVFRIIFQTLPRSIARSIGLRRRSRPAEVIQFGPYALR